VLEGSGQVEAAAVPVFFPFGAFFRQIRTRTEPNMVMASTMGGINRRVRSSAQIDDAGLPRAWSASDADFDAEVPSSSTSTSTAYHARASSSEGLESARHGSAPDEHQGVNTPARRHPGETLLQFCVDAAAGAAADGAGDADAGKRGELALRVADDDRLSSARDLQPDMPLIYVSITSSVLLLYFVAFVDTPSMMRLFTPMDVSSSPGLEQLHTGFSAGASILLGFFVWLLHALLYDIVGMMVGLPPAAITFGCSFAYRVVARNNGYLVFAMLAVVCGLEAGRRVMAWDTRRRRRRSGGYRADTTTKSSLSKGFSKGFGSLRRASSSTVVHSDGGGRHSDRIAI